MKHVLCLLCIVCMATGTQAVVYFTIAPGSGYSEPLSNGDIIEVDVTTQPASAGESLSDSWWTLYYNSIELGELYTSYGAFDLDVSGNLVGSDSLTVGGYTAANRVRLHVTTVLIPPPRHSYSTNYLEVLPTSPMTPSTSTWGLIVLLLAVPVIILWRQ
ncbi:hypothetical protein JXA80_06740 [bacterium]|nr:hypothetical protein [candidate division CSSED10-310 bacterium]